jgi:hypothetical protein
LVIAQNTGGKNPYGPGSCGPLVPVAEPGSITRDQCRSRFEHGPGPIGLHVGARAARGAWIIGPGSWHEPGSLISAFRAIFVQRQGFVFFFPFIYLVCFVFNLMILHIYSNNEGTTLYIYYTSWSRIYYSPSHPSCLVETYYKRYSHEFDLIYIFFFTLHPSK